ncbi:MAG: PQQ-dependent sugar dehydrogenase [Verrucomicrobiae bacterium]|nr:PQQ-dependent sugar dehydrogenase [Verrucomicrobiae bacterium]
MFRVWIAALLLMGASVGTTAGGLVRQPNHSLRLPQNPGRFGFRLVDALNLQFDVPVRVVFPPGETNRVFVVEKGGVVAVVTNIAAPSRTVFLDVTGSTFVGPEEGLLSMAFHPQYASNGRFFVHRVAREDTDDEPLRFNQISEFRVSVEDPSRADPQERVLIRQKYTRRNHYGGDLHFGRDGYLYGSCGDGYAPKTNSQQIDGGFFSAIWRIDVDERPDSLAPNPHPSVIGGYRIPPDNPFVGATSFLGRPVDPARVRTEFWSVGLRNPFRFSLDPETGDPWVGDVGFESSEAVYVSRKGANHGWPAREGGVPGILPESVPEDFFSNPDHGYGAPVFAYDHNSGSCVIGGEVYRGSRFAALYGYLLFSDYGGGWVTAMRPNPGGRADLISLGGYQPRVTSLKVHETTDDLWVSEIAQNRIWKLAYSGVFTGERLPETLAETGAFANLETLEPHPGIVPYEVNEPFWSDGARKRRWFSVPRVEDTFGFRAAGAWESPAGTVWIKHFELEMTNGVPESARRLETRFLVRNSNGVYGVTYRWTSPGNAVLVPEGGFGETIPVVMDGVRTDREWRYPGRGECLACHNQASGWALSFNTAQLNRIAGSPALPSHQIADLAQAGYLHDPPVTLRPLPMLARTEDPDASLEWRARSYLAANCGNCHRPGGPGHGFFDARLETPTALSGLVDGRLLSPGTDPRDRVIAPGDPGHSVLLRRLSTRGPGQMPPLASSVADGAGAQLIRDWILSLATPSPEEPAIVRPHRPEGGYRIRIAQPANRRLRMEWTSRLNSPAWEAMDLPGTEWVFPATARDLEVPIEGAVGTGYLRVLTLAP